MERRSLGEELAGRGTGGTRGERTIRLHVGVHFYIGVFAPQTSGLGGRWAGQAAAGPGRAPRLARFAGRPGRRGGRVDEEFGRRGPACPR